MKTTLNAALAWCASSTHSLDCRQVPANIKLIVGRFRHRGCARRNSSLNLLVTYPCHYCSCGLARCRALVRAWRESARAEAADVPSRRSAFNEALDRRAEDLFVRWCPAFESRFAACKVSRDTRPFFGGFKSTPARRAFDRPIAMACFAERAPCFPSRT
jgi:hypothetical protein